MASHSVFLNLASFEHYPEEAHCIAEKDNCIVPRSLWQSWIDSLDQEILLVEIKQENTKHILVVESHHDFSMGTIYIPPRYLNDFRVTDLAEVRILKEIPPIATKIKLSILEDEFQGFDIASATSEYLSHWNILSKGMILSVPCAELAGYPVDILVVDVEPQNTVLLRGEVTLELEQHETPAPSAPPTPVAHMPIQSSEDTDDFASLLPMNIPQNNNAKIPSKFVAFGGKGNRLGS